jgi:hypothetical protein
MDAFKVQFPFISDFTTDFKADTAVRNQEVMAHIANLPTASTYHATNGYAQGATASESLLEDVPVTLDQHGHVPLKLGYLSSISNKKKIYQETIDNRAYVLGKQIVDYALGKAVAANFTYSESETAVGDTDKETLGRLRKKMNTNGALASGRIGIVNSDAYEALDNDPQITSGDYYGQRVEGNAYGVLSNVAGFKNIYEYPDLPDNSEDLAGLFLESRGIAIATRLPNHNLDYAAELGIPNIANFEVVTDEESGLSMLGIAWQQPNTFDQILTVTLLYGASAGAQGGSAGDITDKAAVRLVAP